MMMRVIPQLGTLAAVQFPAEASKVRRTVVNRAAGGETVLYSDGGGKRSAWRLSLTGLTDAERLSLETFFRSVEGQLHSFVYLDPFENLLTRSHDFQSPTWVKEAPLSLTSGVSDPMGGSEATSAANPSTAARRIHQSNAIPGWFHYSFSVYIRSSGGTPVKLLMKSGSQEVSKTFEAGPAWRRCVLTASPGGPAEAVEAIVEVPPQSTVQVFGAQLEAQPGVSDYKSTGATGGIYPNARLLQDELTWVATAPDANQTILMITSR